MSRRGRSLRPDERAVWTQVARTVKPLPGKRPEPAPEPKPASRDDAPAPSSGPVKAGAAYRAAAPAPKREAADRSREKKVRRGRVEVEARLDLHGMTEAKARRALLRFLERAQDEQMRAVLVITGKGAAPRAVDQRRFEPWDPEARALPGVLRRNFARWMAEPDFAELASGYAPAHRRHGGAGAFYVMIRRIV